MPFKMPVPTGYPKILGGKGVRIATTKVAGRFLGRLVPLVGWGILAKDGAEILYNTHVEFDRIKKESLNKKSTTIY
jgi:hypothetical protein